MRGRGGTAGDGSKQLNKDQTQLKTPDQAKNNLIKDVKNQAMRVYGFWVQGF